MVSTFIPGPYVMGQGPQWTAMMMMTLMVSSILAKPRTDWFGDPVRCDPGRIFWPADGLCYERLQRGPCPWGQVLHEGPRCVRTVSTQGSVWFGDRQADPFAFRDYDYGTGRSSYFGDRSSDERTSAHFRLPREHESIDLRTEECLQTKRVLWPKDDRCYELLQRGPCPAEQWLVLDRIDGEDFVTCRPKKCPCTAENPELCEVYYRNATQGCRCRVALAAEQDKICAKGEQLLIDPYGEGICGCKIKPLHVTWSVDGQCHPLHHPNSPCPTNQTLQFDPVLEKVLCIPTICPEERVLHTDGKCYELNSKGPCEDYEEFAINKETLRPGCQVVERLAKRVFDIIPKNLRGRQMALTGDFAMFGDCNVDSHGRCRNTYDFDDPRIGKRRKTQQGIETHQRKKKAEREKAKRFLKWLRSFRK